MSRLERRRGWNDTVAGATPWWEQHRGAGKCQIVARRIKAIQPMGRGREEGGRPVAKQQSRIILQCVIEVKGRWIRPRHGAAKRRFHLRRGGTPLWDSIARSDPIRLQSSLQHAWGRCRRFFPEIASKLKIFCQKVSATQSVLADLSPKSPPKTNIWSRCDHFDLNKSFQTNIHESPSHSFVFLQILEIIYLKASSSFIF